MESQLPTPPSPLLSIWLKPRETIRRIVETNPTKYVIPLAMLAGIGQSLDRASSRSTGDAIPIVAILALASIAGSIGGLLMLYVGGAIYRWASGRLGGQASPEEIRAALAWSNVPIIAALPLTFLQAFLLGSGMVTSVTAAWDSDPLLARFILGSSIVELVAAIWTFVLLLQTLSEVQRFSVWRALVSMLLLFVVSLVPIMSYAVVLTFLR